MLVAFHCQQYQPQMFLDNLTSSMQNAAAANTSTALMPSASSHYNAISHTTASVHEAQVITRGRTDGSISDIISLDWAAGLSDPHSSAVIQLPNDDHTLKTMLFCGYSTSGFGNN